MTWWRAVYTFEDAEFHVDIQAEDKQEAERMARRAMSMAYARKLSGVRPQVEPIPDEEVQRWPV